VSVYVLISGSLFREPEQRTSGVGKQYCRATIRAATDGEASEFWSILAFGDTAKTELLRLHDGDKVAVQGKPKFEIYEKDGKARVRHTLFADSVMPLRAPPKERKSKAAAAEPAKTNILPPAEPTRTGGLNDDIPF
jgi:single-stranded DNA-binding protein